ncbi:FxsA family protein [Bartonella sp. DGB1]|uniref:FxsA family protein n=1 Tax=Bartonella sp. DGB1 TaxID=3239807 RepID=UPI003523F5F1
MFYRYLPWIFFVLAAIEISLFIFSSMTIGFFTTLFLLIGISLLTILIKRFIRSNPQFFSKKSANTTYDINYLSNAMAINLAQTFFIIPTFTSKILGILLLIPPVRKLIIKTIIPINFTKSKSKSDKTIELSDEDYKNI